MIWIYVAKRCAKLVMKIKIKIQRQMELFIPKLKLSALGVSSTIKISFRLKGRKSWRQRAIAALANWSDVQLFSVVSMIVTNCLGTTVKARQTSRNRRNNPLLHRILNRRASLVLETLIFLSGNHAASTSRSRSTLVTIPLVACSIAPKCFAGARPALHHCWTCCGATFSSLARADWLPATSTALSIKVFLVIITSLPYRKLQLTARFSCNEHLNQIL